MFCKSNRKSAFSLIEIMIVIVIIGLLAGAVAVNVRAYLTRAKQNTARQDIAVISSALDAYWSLANRYPTNDEGLAMLARASEKFSEPLLKNAPVDPWGNSYQYHCPGATQPYEIICLGADGREGGEGADSDIRSDNLR